MKNWLTYALPGLLLVGLTACEKDEVRTTVDFGTPPTLTVSTANAGTLRQADSARTAVTFNWTPYTYNLSTAESVVSPVTYRVQIAKAGTDFAAPVEIAAASSSATSLTLNVFELNRALVTLKFPENQPAQVELRLKTTVAGNQPTLFSAVKPLTAVPYKQCSPPNSDIWALVGPAGKGWPSGSPDTETGIPLTWDCTLNAYTVRTTLSADKFKFRLNQSWTTNLGGPAGDLTQGVALTPGGPDLTIPAAGTYTVKLTVTGSGAATTAGMVTVTP